MVGDQRIDIVSSEARLDRKNLSFYFGFEIDLVHSVNRQADRTQSKVSSGKALRCGPS